MAIKSVKIYIFWLPVELKCCLLALGLHFGPWNIK